MRHCSAHEPIISEFLQFLRENTGFLFILLKKKTTACDNRNNFAFVTEETTANN